MNKLIIIFCLLGWSFSGFSQPAGWSVNPALFNYSMTLTGRIELNCTYLNSSTNYIGAFIGGQCRGVAATNIQAGTTRLGFMQIYSNSPGAQAVELRFYNSATGLISTSIDSTSFLANATIGGISNPFVLTTNHRPTAINLSNLVIQESLLSGGLVAITSANDIDLAQTLSISLIPSSLNNSSFSISGNNLLLNTVLDYAVQNTYQISLIVNDGQGCTLSDTFSITVNDVSFAPVAVNDTFQVTEDVLLPLTVLMNDTDYDNDINPSSLTILAAPLHGTYTILPNGVINYTPNLNFFGMDSLVYSICDMTTPGVLCDTAKVILNVLGVDEAPVAVNDSVFTIENTTLNFNPTGNDYDVDGNLNLNAVTIITMPIHGTLTNGISGAMTYIPTTFFNGLDSFVYQICDLTSPIPMCDTAVVYITTIPVPNPPVAINDTLQGLEDVVLPLTVLLNDTDGDNDIDSASVSVIQNPVHGTYTITTMGTINYQPNLNFFGTDSLVYSVCDFTLTGALCDTAKVFITILPVDDAPMAFNDSISTLEDVFVNFYPTLNDFDADTNLNPSSVVIISSPLHGTATLGALGAIIYTPNTFYNGFDSLVYQVCDLTSPIVLCDTAVVYFTIIPVPNAPVAFDDSVQGMEDNLLPILVLSNDTDGDNDIDSASVSVIQNPVNGTYTVTSTGTINYQPNLNFFGTDSLIYTVCDLTAAGALCDTAKVIVIILPVEDAPVAVNDTVFTLEDVVITFDPIANDTDSENNINASSVTVLSAPLHGTIVVSVSGTITYTPNAFFNGLDSLVYEVCDFTLPIPLCATATVYLNVEQVGNTPTDIILDSATVIEDNSISTLIDYFETTDPDLPDDYFEYSLVSGTGDSDNAQFSILGNALYIETKTNYDIKKDYFIRVRTTDSFGLFFEKSFVVKVIDVVGNSIPLPATSYISNNADGKNDFFTIENVVIYDYFNLKIFDQFGRIVFEKDRDYNNEFDGTRDGEKLPTGAYYYIFSSDSKKYQGNLTIMN